MLTYGVNMTISRFRTNSKETNVIQKKMMSVKVVLYKEIPQELGGLWGIYGRVLV